MLTPPTHPWEPLVWTRTIAGLQGVPQPLMLADMRSLPSFQVPLLGQTEGTLGPIGSVTTERGLVGRGLRPNGSMGFLQTSPTGEAHVEGDIEATWLNVFTTDTEVFTGGLQSCLDGSPESSKGWTLYCMIEPGSECSIAMIFGVDSPVMWACTSDEFLGRVCTLVVSRRKGGTWWAYLNGRKKLAATGTTTYTAGSRTTPYRVGQYANDPYAQSFYYWRGTHYLSAMWRGTEMSEALIRFLAQDPFSTVHQVTEWR